ncbi:hypothetical protein TanjilG_22465 [Lupinus angustifolius]|uniref:S-acyltransferase n=1 Tax=Lupinus angustifolius TaxID=3871 RepID=A0A4P1RSR0_LUPAN|nr:PREDICTED: protein S-acyltransferase 11-like [Lupinus angustifolius]XP_019420637.1 PREDICTED: protein S-acyltransferase 11-like [Lupinus angustifolius]OIW17353.1 hypothetical protein TanjilG_22465 [Lupinus angustifolius]
MASASPEEDQSVTEVTDNYETTCWGCGLHILLPSCTSIFKCGWCGAITDQNKKKRDDKCVRWRLLRDRCVLCVVVTFMLLVIFGGVWAIYPIVFSLSLLCGVFHSTIIAILSIATISFFSLAAFRCAGTPPNILWGSYPTVGKGDLENYTFCQYCSKPKSPRAHHCRSCGKCILDMDHHCPFIGNCVGAANHRNFIFFLISAVSSTIYISIMAAYASTRIWPPLKYSVGRPNAMSQQYLAWRVIKEIIFAFLGSALLLSSRGLVLLYLFISSLSLQIGLVVLLWQQLSYIYHGKTYLSNLSSSTDNEEEKKDCQNIVRFFGFQYPATRFLPTFHVVRKRHVK